METLLQEVWHLFVSIELLLDKKYPNVYIRKWSTKHANRYLSKCCLKWFNARQLKSPILRCLFLQISAVPHHQTFLMMYLQELQKISVAVSVYALFLAFNFKIRLLGESFVYIDNDLGKEKLCP